MIHLFMVYDGNMCISWGFHYKCTMGFQQKMAMWNPGILMKIASCILVSRYPSFFQAPEKIPLPSGYD